MKWGRNYEIRIKTPDGDLITIKPPITAIVEVDRVAQATQNNCRVTLYNLKESTRNKIYRDTFDFNRYWQMSIVAGYGNSELYEIFRGNIQMAASQKQGTEWITEIEGYDAAYAIQNGFMNETVTAGTSKIDVFKRVIHSLPGLIAGVAGKPVQGQNKRGQVLFGPSYDILKDQTDNQVIIDMETVNAISDDEIIIDDYIPVIGDPADPNNGTLLSTPKRRNTFLEIESIFYPECRVLHAIEIHSMDKRYDGQYKIIGIKHSVRFSGADSGDARTMLSLSGGKVFNRLAK